MSFIRDLLKANEGNECPREYIIWSGYAALSLAAGRRYFVDLEQFQIGCGIYICLVGPAGNRKTFARDKVADMLTEAIPDVIIASECETKQGITAFMSQDEQVRYFVDHNGNREEERPYGIFASELMNYLALDPAGMITFLTDVKDRKYYRYRLKREFHYLKHPYVVMLACTVPDWLTSQIKSEEFCAGFGRRTIFVCNDSDIRMKPFKDEEAHLAEKRAVEDLRRVHAGAGIFKLSPDASRWFWDEWYTDKKVHKLAEDPFLKSWGRSKHIQLLTVAMLTWLSENRDDCLKKEYGGYILQKPHMQFALELLDNVEAQVSMITDRMGKSEVIGPHQAIISFIRSKGGWAFAKDVRMETLKHFKDTRAQWSSLEFMKSNGQFLVVPPDKNVHKREIFALPGAIQVASQPPPPSSPSSPPKP